MIDLTRRQWIVVAPAAVVGGLEAVLGRSSDAATTKRRITFEEARANINLRQKYIDQLVKEEFGDEASTFVDEFVYDHDRSSSKEYARKEAYAEADRLLSIQKFVEELKAEFGTDPEFKKLSDKELRLMIERRIAVPREKLAEKRKDSYWKKIDRGEAATILTGDKKQKKSKIYLFKSIFEDKDFSIIGLGQYKATEETIKVKLRHEYRHAVTNFDGRYDGLKPEVREFATETDAHIYDTNYALKFGEQSPTYMVSLLGLAVHVYYTMVNPRTAINPIGYEGRSKTAIEHHIALIEEAGKRHPLIRRLLEKRKN